VHGPFTHTCRFLGELLSQEPCTCGAAGKIAIYQCHNPDVKRKRCVRTKHEQSKFVDKDLKLVTTACDQCALREMTPIFVSTDQLWADVKLLISRLPPDVTRIVGVARSGVNIASMVAMFLHVPFSIVRQSDGDLIDAGSGWRLWQGAPKAEGRTVVVDDTCMTGNSLKAVLPIVQQHFRHVQTATVYVNPLSAQKPNYYVKSLPWPHVLEWNMFNSVNTASCAFDFDGILCHDCPSHEDDDGPRYLNWLRSVKPLYYVRRTSIPLIITARLEKYREPTLEWLERHGMRVDELIMGPWETRRERLEADIAAWKAGHAKTWFSRPDRLKPKMLIESNSSLAKTIAELAGGIVVCPAAKRCYP